MKTKLTKDQNERTIWHRGLYMVLFAMLLSVAKVVTIAIMAFQFVSVLFSGSSNRQLKILGQGLSTYHYQILIFLTFNGESLPYPFAEWPKGALKQGGEG
ncbi:MAG: DUF4389 domain-containing protein [Gammaproteobacteria bacterium]|nr:DUF4389 domain-containing protein [Gammaproteobacteria bacterium]